MIELDRNADTFPAGLLGTPFEAVYRALRIVAATVWDVDPLTYRAGMAWGWYALHDPAALAGFRDVVTAALISAVAPMVKDTQTDAELVEYLRQWRSYTPTFPKLQALYALFGAVVDVQSISDPESQTVLPVDDTRLAFYLRIESIDFSRPLSLAEAREIAVRATPLGSRPYPYYALETRIPCAVLPAPVGIYIRVENWELAAVPTPPTPPQDYMDVFLWLKADHLSAPSGFSADDYWGGYIQTDADKTALEAFGVPLYDVTTSANVAIDRDAEQNFTFVPMALYTGVNETDIGASMGNFYCMPRFASSSGTPFYGICIWSIGAMSNTVRTWKCRVMRNTGTVAYFSNSSRRVPITIGNNESQSLYFPDGEHIGYSSTRTYTALKYYINGADYTGTPADGIVIGGLSGWDYLFLTNRTGATITIQRVEYTIS